MGSISSVCLAVGLSAHRAGTLDGSSVTPPIGSRLGMREGGSGYGTAMATRPTQTDPVEGARGEPAADDAEETRPTHEEPAEGAEDDVAAPGADDAA
jgi:hypothetical protein